MRTKKPAEITSSKRSYKRTLVLASLSLFGLLGPVAWAILPDFARHEYVGQAEGRDFFFLTRKHKTS